MVDILYHAYWPVSKYIYNAYASNCNDHATEPSIVQLCIFTIRFCCQYVLLALSLGNIWPSWRFPSGSKSNPNRTIGSDRLEILLFNILKYLNRTFIFTFWYLQCEFEYMIPNCLLLASDTLCYHYFYVTDPAVTGVSPFN